MPRPPGLQVDGLTGNTSTRKLVGSGEAKKKQHVIHVKEVKFRPGIEEHDYEFKVAPCEALPRRGKQSETDDDVQGSSDHASGVGVAKCSIGLVEELQGRRQSRVPSELRRPGRCP